MKKGLKKIFGIGILVPILFLVIGLNIKPKCVTFDVTDDLSLASINTIVYSAHIISDDIANREISFILNVEYLTPEDEYRQFRLSYNHVYHTLDLTTASGTSILYNNDTLDNLFIIFSLSNVGQDVVVIDYYLYKNNGSSFLLIDSTEDFQYGFGRFYKYDLMLFQYNSANLTAFGNFYTDVILWRENPIGLLSNWVFNINDLLNQSYTYGFRNGRTEGYNQGLEDAGAFADNLWFFTPIISGISSLLAIQIFPNVSIGTFLLIPLALGIIALILVFWRKD